MFSKLFNRSKVTPVTAPARPAPAPAPVTNPPFVDESTKTRLEAFREEWDSQWEASHEVIEGNGGNTDWGAWTEAVEKEENSFAPTVPMPLKPE
jgi:hypothetical protein